MRPRRLSCSYHLTHRTCKPRQLLPAALLRGFCPTYEPHLLPPCSQPLPQCEQLLPGSFRSARLSRKLPRPCLPHSHWNPHLPPLSPLSALLWSSPHRADTLPSLPLPAVSSACRRFQTSYRLSHAWHAPSTEWTRASRWAHDKLCPTSWILQSSLLQFRSPWVAPACQQEDRMPRRNACRTVSQTSLSAASNSSANFRHSLTSSKPVSTVRGNSASRRHS
mmetsp:Transcript_39848/g.93284  ORF Transcript_39848/g.93284 Transcript_39848/m.93284 type:complete len:221 (+) Transcript_39848:874-1536(+)